MIGDPHLASGDGESDGGNDVVASQLGVNVCTWSNDADEKCRAFVVNNFPWDSTIIADDQIREMQSIFDWIRTGKMPSAGEPPKLKVIGK